jgi:hypothetical protein
MFNYAIGEGLPVDLYFVLGSLLIHPVEKDHLLIHLWDVATHAGLL